MLFAELAHTLVAPNGRVGLLTPSGIATDDSTKEFFQQLIDDQALIALYDFENKDRIFPDVDSRFKFCTLIFGGSASKAPAADFVFFARNVFDLDDHDRHIPLSADDIRLLNPNTKTCPIFRSRKDADLTKAVYQRVPILIDESRKKGGNPWGIKFFTMFHQTNDAELFLTPAQLKKKKYAHSGNCWTRGKQVCLPLYEAKMVQAYDHRAAGVVVEHGNWVRQGQTAETSLVAHQNFEFLVQPRWWVHQPDVLQTLPGPEQPAYLCFKDVTSPTNQRTMIASWIPHVGLVNSAPLMLTDPKISPRRLCCLLANLNAFALDFIARQKVGNVHLNFFIVKQLPLFPPDTYDQKCPWTKTGTLEKWIADRVLKLTCTANDMIPLAKACAFKPSVHKWNPTERTRLLAELDAAYFLLYGITRPDVLYILSTFQTPQQPISDGARTYTTTELILDAYDHLTSAS